MPNASAFFRRYTWSDLTDPEKEAVKDTATIATTRAAVGLGAVLTVAAAISNARRGKPPLPPFLRYGSLAFFSLAGAYAGLLSAGQLYADRILSIPNSRLADDLRTVAGDWQARVPTATGEQPLHLQALSPGPPHPGEQSHDNAHNRSGAVHVAERNPHSQN